LVDLRQQIRPEEMSRQTLAPKLKRLQVRYFRKVSFSRMLEQRHVIRFLVKEGIHPNEIAGR
jgi:hypothetical protein